MRLDLAGHRPGVQVCTGLDLVDRLDNQRQHLGEQCQSPLCGRRVLRHECRFERLRLVAYLGCAEHSGHALDGVQQQMSNLGVALLDGPTDLLRSRLVVLPEFDQQISVEIGVARDFANSGDSIQAGKP